METPPKEETLINIASEIPEDKRDEIALEIIDHCSIDLDSRSDWEEKRNRWYKLWMCEREKKVDPWEGASNVCIPMLATASNQFHARAYQSIFAPPGMVKCIPVGENDLKRAMNVEKFLNWQTMYDMEEYEEEFDKLLQLLPINGTNFKKTYYCPIKDRPVSEYISTLDFILPYRTKSLETARRKTHRLWLHYDELMDRDEQGLYIDFDQVKEKPAPNPKHKAAIRDTADKAVGEEGGNAGEEPHVILEVHKKYNLGDKRMPYVFTVDADSQKLLRATKAEIDGKELNYFTDYHFIPNPEGFYSFGFGHFLEPLNEMANTAFNQFFDGGRLTNTPFGFYGRRAGFKKKKIKLAPGMMTEVEDAKQIYFPTMQRMDNILPMILGLVQQYAEQFTSTSDYIMGRESKGTKTPTAHGTLAIIEQGLVTFAVMTKRIFRSLRKELRIIMELNQLFMKESKQYRVMESTKDIPFPTVKKKDFDSVYDVIPIGDPSYASSMMRRQESVQLYQLLMTNPLIVGNPQTGEGQNKRAIHTLTSSIIESFDRKDKGLILPDLPEEMLSPETENALFMQGDYVEPQPQENLDLHIKTHTEFKKTQYFRDMDTEFKKLVNKHIVATTSLKYMVEKQVKELRGEQGAPVAPQREKNPAILQQGVSNEYSVGGNKALA